MAAPDIYATAKANLRDNVKTLITVFGGIAGVLLAGTPFSGFGALDPFSGRWWIASVSLLGAIVVVGLSVRVLLKVLEPDLAYTSALRNDFALGGLPPSEQKELQALRDEFAARKGELLPGDIGSIEKLEQNADDAWEEYMVATAQEAEANLKAAAAAASGTVFTPPAKNSVVDAARQQFEDVNDDLTKINHWSAFTRLHYRVRRGVDDVLKRGVIALMLIGAFSWCVSAQKDKPAGSSVVVIGNLTPVTEGRSDLPPIKPIQFVTGKWDLSKEAIDMIGTARDYLRSHPETGVLVFAYTDTQGGPKVNRSLAAKRADVVARALMGEGGISASRVFVTRLPETDLPVLTGQDADSETNRAVQLMLIPMPARK